MTAEPSQGRAPVAVGALKRGGCRVVQKESRAVDSIESGGVTQPAKVVEGWKGVLDHLRREVPAPMRTATVLFHAERASTRSRASASDMPVRRATSASASPRGAPLERRSSPLLESIARKTRRGARARSWAPPPTKPANEVATLGPRRVGEVWAVPCSRVLDDCTRLVRHPTGRRFPADSSEASRAFRCVVLLKRAALVAPQIRRERHAPVRRKRA